MSGWNASQRRVLILLCVGMVSYLAFRLMRDRALVSNPQPVVGPRANEVADRIDPNTCDWPTLAALPSIGEKRARDIIAFREKWVKEHSGDSAFIVAEDLQRVKGIGPATVSQIRGYLIFPTTQSAR